MNLIITFIVSVFCSCLISRLLFKKYLNRARAEELVDEYVWWTWYWRKHLNKVVNSEVKIVCKRENNNEQGN